MGNSSTFAMHLTLKNLNDTLYEY